jgi:hypothetical protein
MRSCFSLANYFVDVTRWSATFICLAPSVQPAIYSNPFRAVSSHYPLCNLRFSIRPMFPSHPVFVNYIIISTGRGLSRDPISLGFPGTVPVSCVLKILGQLSCKIWFGTPNIPGFPTHKIFPINVPIF